MILTIHVTNEIIALQNMFSINTIPNISSIAHNSHAITPRGILTCPAGHVEMRREACRDAPRGTGRCAAGLMGMPLGAISNAPKAIYLSLFVKNFLAVDNINAMGWGGNFTTEKIVYAFLDF